MVIGGGKPAHYSTHVCAVIRQVVSWQVIEVPPEWCLDLQTEGSRRRKGGEEGGSEWQSRSKILPERCLNLQTLGRGGDRINGTAPSSSTLRALNAASICMG